VKQDPLALAFFGAALALLAGLLLYVFAFREPEPAAPARSGDVVEALRRKLADMPQGTAVTPPAPRAARPAPRPVPAPVAPPPDTAAGSASVAGSRLEAGHTWTYAVVVDPPAWRDITLTYRTRREGAGIGVLTDFVHAGGKSNFHLGVFAAGHPSHANTRFPGFFMYPAYFRLPLEPGQKFDWSWSWQPEREGRRKAWYAQVVRRERVTVPAGSFDALVLQLNLAYLEGDEVRARALEFIWYAPEVSQIVKITRHGRTPDEGLESISAELAEYR